MGFEESGRRKDRRFHSQNYRSRSGALCAVQQRRDNKIKIKIKIKIIKTALKVELFSLEQPDFVLSNAPRLHRFECSHKQKIQGRGVGGGQPP